MQNGYSYNVLLTFPILHNTRLFILKENSFLLKFLIEVLLISAVRKFCCFVQFRHCISNTEQFFQAILIVRKHCYRALTLIIKPLIRIILYFCQLKPLWKPLKIFNLITVLCTAVLKAI